MSTDAAHEQLDQAVTALLRATEAFDPTAVVTGYTLIVAGIQFDDDPDSDPEDAVSVTRAFYKRGQSPHLTRGMVETFRDEMRG